MGFYPNGQTQNNIIKHEGNGIACAVLKRIENDSREDGLCMIIACNVEAINFFKYHNFVKVGNTGDYLKILY